MKKRDRRWLGTAAAAVLLILIFWRFSQSPEWRQFSWERVGSLLVHANPLWLGAAVVLTLSSYLIRAYRWKFFLDPFKPSSLRVLFTGQILGFSVVYLIGRPGEIVRPAYIARAADVPFASQLAIWLLERIYDSVALALLFALALDLELIAPGGAHAALTLRRMHEGAVAVLLGTAGLVAALVVFRFREESLIRWASGVLSFLPGKFRKGLAKVARSFGEGLDVVQNWRDLVASVLSTVLLWVVNISVFWAVWQSLGGRLAGLSWWTATVVAFLAGLGLVLQLPGVGGGFQVAILLALEQLFHISATDATSAAVLQWLVLLVPCVVLGLVLLVYGGLSFGHLKAMAQTARQPNPREHRTGESG